MAAEWDIRFCVLASGSMGNCSIVSLRRGSEHRCVLVDLGLSPRRTFRLLKDLDISPEQVTDVLVTHFDNDHFQSTWTRQLPDHTAVHFSRRHMARAERSGLLFRRTRPFEDGIDLVAGGSVKPLMMSHDESGVAVFRIMLPNGADMGFATDLGRVQRTMIDHFAGVDLLAIESNYCPVMQMASNRSSHLKRRIMSGAGHLSNQQCLDAIAEIQPKDHVVLLHLSQECNCPELVAGMHAGSDYALTITSQEEPSRWIPVKARMPRVRVSQFGSLFEAV